MSRRTARLQPLRVALHGPSLEGVIGVHAAPPYLCHPIYRWPGESVEGLAARARAACVGSGLVALRLMYADCAEPASVPGAQGVK